MTSKTAVFGPDNAAQSIFVRPVVSLNAGLNLESETNESGCDVTLAI